MWDLEKPSSGVCSEACEHQGPCQAMVGSGGGRGGLLPAYKGRASLSRDFSVLWGPGGPVLFPAMATQSQVPSLSDVSLRSSS